MVTLPALPSLLSARAARVDHVAFAVKNLDAAVWWHVNVLGFKLVDQRETRGQRSGMVSAVVTAGAVTFVLTQGIEPDSQVSRFLAQHGPGVTHVAVEVSGLDEIVAELRAAGVEFATEVIRSDGLLQIFTKRDPHSGLMLELIERRGGTFSNHSVEQLYRQLEAQGLY